MSVVRRVSGKKRISSDPPPFLTVEFPVDWFDQPLDPVQLALLRASTTTEKWAELWELLLARHHFPLTAGSAQSLVDDAMARGFSIGRLVLSRSTSTDSIEFHDAIGGDKARSILAGAQPASLVLIRLHHPGLNTRAKAQNADSMVLIKQFCKPYEVEISCVAEWIAHLTARFAEFAHLVASDRNLNTATVVRGSAKGEDAPPGLNTKDFLHVILKLTLRELGLGCAREELVDLFIFDLYKNNETITNKEIIDKLTHSGIPISESVVSRRFGKIKTNFQLLAKKMALIYPTDFKV